MLTASFLLIVYFSQSFYTSFFFTEKKLPYYIHFFLQYKKILSNYYPLLRIFLVCQISPTRNQ